jgi:hypothetical protein
MPTNRSITDIARLSMLMEWVLLVETVVRLTLQLMALTLTTTWVQLLPGGGSPISIDAIEEIQVVSFFDVRQSNFIGGYQCYNQIGNQ